jgi:non-ribosomal peptide synthetase component F
MGGPKGMVIPHRALVRTFVDCGYADFGPDTVMPMLAAPHWDGGALEVFGPLCNGGCVVEAESGLLTPAELRRLVREEGLDGHLQAPRGRFAPGALAFLSGLLDTEFSALLGENLP